MVGSTRSGRSSPQPMGLGTDELDNYGWIGGFACGAGWCCILYIACSPPAWEKDGIPCHSGDVFWITVVFVCDCAFFPWCCYWIALHRPLSIADDSAGFFCSSPPPSPCWIRFWFGCFRRFHGDERRRGSIPPVAASWMAQHLLLSLGFSLPCASRPSQQYFFFRFTFCDRV